MKLSSYFELYNTIENFLRSYNITFMCFFNFLVHGRDGWIRFSSGLPKNHGHSFTTFFYACLHSFWSQPCFHTSYQKRLKSKKRRLHEEDLQGSIQRAIKSQKKLRFFMYSFNWIIKYTKYNYFKSYNELHKYINGSELYKWIVYCKTIKK